MVPTKVNNNTNVKQTQGFYKDRLNIMISIFYLNLMKLLILYKPTGII